MADVENPDDGGALEAEPAECCRCMYTCAMGFFFLALIVLCIYTMENFRPTSKLLGVVAAALGILASFVACWFAIIFMILVTEWYHGNPDGGERFVDSLIQSDRGFFKESLHQYILRIDDLHVDVDA
jgi:hypothetical protein